MPDSLTLAPQIFDYHDYRLFLKDWFKHLENTQTGFSMRRLAREAKIATGYLPMVISGHRSLSKSMWERLSPYVKLNTSEQMHFELLRSMSEAATSEVKTEVLARIQKKKNYQENHPKEFETYKYLTHWYFVAIREMAALKGFKLDAKWIQSRLRAKVPLANITKAIDFLTKHGFIQIVSGKPKLVRKNLDCMGGVHRLALRKFHKEMFTLTRDSIESTPSDERYILGHTLALPSDKLDEVKAILDEALAKIERLGLKAQSGDVVHHVTLATAPLTKTEKRSAV